MTKQSRRLNARCSAALRSGAAAVAAVFFLITAFGAPSPAPVADGLSAEVLTLDASAPTPAAEADGFHMGAPTAPGGHTLTLDSRSLLRDGKPWIPVSGEFHFSRCPESEWRDELLKMKAGGVSIVTTYIFWIHHEEVEGAWDWTGRRDLRKFIQTCQSVGLDVLLRIGPWAHGEARNGGFPDWLQKKGDDHVFELRRDNPGYLGYVTELYGQIARQAQGLLWKDGGPVIAVQLENEFGGPASHLMTLKRVAREAGIDVPLYTCTGWGGGGATPFGEMVPLSGAYADGFWDRSLTAMPRVYDGALRFSGSRRGSAEAMGAVGAPAAPGNASRASAGAYPFLTCELGGGMMASYHRRILIYPEDTESLALVKLGSGANLLGFYMYHGGENPEGRLTTLNETQATGYWNDLPVKNYDFEAPIGEFGQERVPYHALRQLGLFLTDFGQGLAGMSARLPDATSPLNWAVRSDGTSGYLFVSHYQRSAPQPNRENVQFKIKLSGGEVAVPSEPVTIPNNSRFFWPLNEEIGGVKLVSATAQPIAQLAAGAVHYTVFKQTGSIPTEFVFDAATATVEAANGQITTGPSRIQVRQVQPGTGAAIRLRSSDGGSQVILLLDEATSLDLWKGQWQGRERLFLTHDTLLLDGPDLRLSTENPEGYSVGILPAPTRVNDGKGAVPGKDDGLFRRFSPRLPPIAQIQAKIAKVQPAGPARAIPIAPSVPSRTQGMAMEPEDSDFAEAAVWRVTLPAGVDSGRNLRLRVRYTGDVARAYLGDTLLTDDFYHARPFEIGLRRFGPAVYREGLVLKILPLREDAPLYFTDRSYLKFGDTHTALTLDGVDVVETREVRLEAAER